MEAAATPRYRIGVSKEDRGEANSGAVIRVFDVIDVSLAGEQNFQCASAARRDIIPPPARKFDGLRRANG